MPSWPDARPLGYCLVCGTPLEARHHEDRERPTCPSCGFIHYLDPKVAVAVVLGDERGVLLCRRLIDPGSGLWSFPAGYVNRGEVLEEAAVREVLEELGLAVKLRGIVGVYSERGEPVVLVDDILRSGSKLTEMKTLLESRGASVMGLAVIIYQPTPNTRSFGSLPLYYLAKLEASYYTDAQHCDLCRRGVKLEKVWV